MAEITPKKWAYILIVFIINPLILCVFWWVGFIYGQYDVRTHTTIIYDDRYVPGPYFGECTNIGRFRVCAADKRDEKQKYVPPAVVGCDPRGGLYFEGYYSIQVPLDRLTAAASTICPPTEKPDGK